MVKSVIRFLFENSIFLIVGAITALLWANSDNESYKHLLHLPLFENGFFYDHNYFNEQVSSGVSDPKKVFTLHYLVNDVFMALFFAIAGKEVFEATLPGGALSNFRTAATPLIATTQPRARTLKPPVPSPLARRLEPIQRFQCHYSHSKTP